MQTELCFSRQRWLARLIGVALAAWLNCGEGWSFEPPPAVSRSVDFRRDVHPILSARCFKCHSGKEPSAGVKLDDLDEITGESTGEPLVQVGRSADSRLIQLVAGLDKGLRMPPTGDLLPVAEIAVLRAWIDQGLVWDAELLPPVAAKSDHWAFQPVTRPAVPVTPPSHRKWVANPIDSFIAAKHVEKGLTPAEPADRRVLIRRLSLDLLGLPPKPDEVAAFVGDKSPQAFEKLVDRYLASPHYGERWGRHWLDVARWAESEGYESNHPRTTAWRYRDWVIEAFNSDKPYDQFVRQQIAGDELTPYSDENLIATGFLAAARLSSNEEDKWLQRNAVLVDITNAVGNAFLGLTINCAQCHNHKFDPISIRDYYRLQSFFLRGQPANVALQGEDARRDYEARRPAEYESARQLKEALFASARTRHAMEVRKTLPQDQIAALDTPSDQRTVAQELLARDASLKWQVSNGQIEKYIAAEDRALYDAVKRKVDEIEKQGIAEPHTLAFYSPVTSPHSLRLLPMLGFYPLPFEPSEFARLRSYLKIRGEVHGIGPTVAAGVPAVLAAVESRETRVERTTTSTIDVQSKALDSRLSTLDSSRQRLADWLTDRRNPLVARVWVNRIWQFHFGRGLVATPSDFGARGSAPSHPELLDWLASELMDHGWSTKHVQRLIVSSSTYRQASSYESVRVRELEGGRSASPAPTPSHSRTLAPSPLHKRANNSGATPDPDNIYLTRWQPRRLEAETLRDSLLAVAGELDTHVGGLSVPLTERDTSRRRTLYLFQKRGVPPDVQSLFDGPSEVAESCESRYVSTTPLQSLYLLNNTFVLDRAKAFSQRLRQATGDDTERFIEQSFLATLGRPPDDVEREDARRYLGTGSRVRDASFCHTLLNLNEFMFVE
jgi:hypothetical protein